MYLLVSISQVIGCVCCVYPFVCILLSVDMCV